MDAVLKKPLKRKKRDYNNGSLVPRPFEEEEKGPGTHRLRMRHVFRKTHRKIIRKFMAYTWIIILTSEAE